MGVTLAWLDPKMPVRKVWSQKWGEGLWTTCKWKTFLYDWSRYETDNTLKVLVASARTVSVLPYRPNSRCRPPCLRYLLVDRYVIDAQCVLQRAQPWKWSGSWGQPTWHQISSSVETSSNMELSVSPTAVPPVIYPTRWRVSAVQNERSARNCR